MCPRILSRIHAWFRLWLRFRLWLPPEPFAANAWLRSIYRAQEALDLIFWDHALDRVTFGHNAAAVEKYDSACRNIVCVLNDYAIACVFQPELEHIAAMFVEFRFR